MNSSRRKLPWLLALVAAVRGILALLVWWHSSAAGFLENDSQGYISLAQSLAHGSFGSTTPEILRTPGYPLLLAPGALFNHVLLLAIIENIILSAGCAWLVWRIASDSVGEAAAVWATLLYCFEPVGLIYSVRILSEMPFCFLFLLFVWLLLRYFRSPGFLLLFYAALALALASYVRPISLYLPFVLIPLLLLFPRTLARRERWSAAVIFPALFVLLLAPWILRNARLADYRGFSSSGDYNLYFNGAAAVRARLQHEEFLRARYALGFGHYYEVHPEQTSWTPGQIARFQRKEGLKAIVGHISTYLPIHARGSLVVLFDTGGTAIASLMGIYPPNGGHLLTHVLDVGLMRGVWWFLRSYPLAACLWTLLEVALLVFYVLAIHGLTGMDGNISALFLVTAGYFILLSAMPGAVGRYRAPWMPFLCVAAGADLAARLETRSRAQTA